MKIIDRIRLVVTQNNHREMLVVAEPGGHCLPSIEIPSGERLAKSITRSLEDTWGLETICLFGWNTEPIDNGPLAPYQVLESRNGNWVPPCGLKWSKREFLVGRTAQYEADAAIAERALMLADAFNARSFPGPFARSGWVDALIEWMKPELRASGQTLIGPYQQWNGSPFSTLVRFETSAGAVWFKGFDPANLGGFLTTPVLASLHPDHVPQVLAVHHEWNGLLISDVGGQRLDVSPTFDNWQFAVSAMARIQVKDIRRTTELMKRGFKDRTLPAILETIDRFFESMGEVMQRQMNTPPPILTSSDLRRLAVICKSACQRLMNGRIPLSVMHGDVGPHNVLICGQRTFFIDWSDAYIGHPFLFWEYMLAFMERDYPEIVASKDQLRRSYSHPWESFATLADIEEAFTLTPIVAPLFSALAAMERLAIGHGTHLEKFLRSLVRLIERRIDAFGAEKVA